MIIYTVITREDCPVPTQPFYDSNFKYICLHSVDVEKKFPWSYVKIKNEKNPYYTLNKYRILSPFKQSVYVDGKNVINKNFYNKYHRFLKEDIVVDTHPDRNGFLDEIVDWLILPVFSYEEAINYIIDVKNMGYPFPENRGLICSFIYRNNVDDFNRMWWSHWLKFEKRNQLSFYIAEYFTNKKIYINQGYSVETPVHQPEFWTDHKLRNDNLKKIKNFENDLLELGIEYKLNKEALKFRGIEI